MIIRPRRLRANELIRKMTRETRMSPDSLIYPVFIREGRNIAEDIASMQGQHRYSVDMAARELEAYLKSGVKSFILFGIPNDKDETGSGAYAENGVVQEAVRFLKKQFGQDIFLITDVCLCEYTSHGHCGLIENGVVDNDSSTELISRAALSHAQAGCDMVAPSDMMDGRVLKIRRMLGENGYSDTPIMSYAVKYASAFYAPFRDAAGSSPKSGDRKSYQMDYHNTAEALREALLDVEQGADILIVKPMLSYLDIVSRIARNVNIPVAAYSVSGEYAMIKAAAHNGFIDEYKIICETATGAFRAGADILITYYAKELAEAMKRGDIG